MSMQSNIKNALLAPLIIIIEIVLFILIFYRWNPYGISDTYTGQITLLALIIMFINIVMFYFIKERERLTNNMSGVAPSVAPSVLSVTKKVLSTVAFILIIVILIAGMYWLLRHVPSAHSVMTYTINILIFTGALTLVYLVFNRIKSRDFREKPNDGSWMTFITNLVFYIPKLLIKFLNYVKYEYSITSSVVWLVVLAEVALITLRIIIPMILKKMVTHNGVNLLDKPVYLNKQHTLGSFESLHTDADNNKFKYNYALSAWFYINPQPPNTSSAYTKYSTIINYGQKPLIQYNGLENTIRVQTEIENGKLVTIYETKDIKYQKWNNIVVNYDGGNMDIFINGKIVGTRTNVVPYMTYENVIVGEDNGIHGGICNVNYFNDILSLSYINLLYKTLNERNMPVI